MSYMVTVQTDLKQRMRCVLFCWLVDVNLKFRLREESLWHSFMLIDRFLSKKDIKRNRLQLIGATCLWIASKYHEIYPPLARDFVYIADNAFTVATLQQAEVEVLNTL